MDFPELEKVSVRMVNKGRVIANVTLRDGRFEHYFTGIKSNNNDEIICFPKSFEAGTKEDGSKRYLSSYRFINDTERNHYSNFAKKCIEEEMKEPENKDQF